MDNELNLFECYVELMAELVNIFLVGGNFNNLFKLEITHCLFQVGKILNYYGYSSWNDFYKEEGWIEKNKTQKYKQKSNIFSYFIFRSLIMFNIDDFIELCFSKNKIHFLKQEFNSSELLNIMIKTLKDIRFKNIIDNFILINNKGIKNKGIKNKGTKNLKLNQLIFKNLRMTCVENVI